MANRHRGGPLYRQVRSGFFLRLRLPDGFRIEMCFYANIHLFARRFKDKAPLEIWKQALENITPQVEVKSRRIGGATFQVPTEVRPERKISLSMKNLVLYSRKRAGKSMAEKLSAEIIAAYNQEGAAFKRKEEMHRMAEANKAFAHFRF